MTASAPKRLRCMVLATWYPSAENPVDGVFVREAARAIAQRHDVSVLHAAPDAGRVPGVRSDRVEDGLRTVRVGFPPLPTAQASLPLRLLALAAGYRRLATRGFAPDIIHAHVYLSGFAGEVVGRRRVPVVISEHLSAFVTGTIGRPQRALARVAFERADLVCPVSEDLGRRLAVLAPRARLRAVPNPVDTDIFHPASPVPSRAGRPARILAVARLHKRKGIDHLLRALTRVRADRAAVLEIAGDGPDRRPLEDLAAGLGLSGAVTFLGMREHAAVADLMRRADLLVLPSLAENLPTVVLEAHACGLPVVATDVGGTREAIDARAGRVVTPGDAGTLADAIGAVLACDHDHVAIADRARARYGYDAIAARWDAIYREVLAARELS
jgi:glycosyltransferase involved in cell wall biosynthesis